jgi:hypothetical protein
LKLRSFYLRLIPIPSEFAKLFGRQQSAIPLFWKVDTFLGFALNSFEKRQATTCHFSKEFCENSGNAPTSRKKGKN